MAHDDDDDDDDEEKEVRELEEADNAKNNTRISHKSLTIYRRVLICSGQHNSRKVIKLSIVKLVKFLLFLFHLLLLLFLPLLGEQRY